MPDFDTLGSLTLISRKIWVTEKAWKFQNCEIAAAVRWWPFDRLDSTYAAVFSIFYVKMMTTLLKKMGQLVKGPLESRLKILTNSRHNAGNWKRDLTRFYCAVQVQWIFAALKDNFLWKWNVNIDILGMDFTLIIHIFKKANFLYLMKRENSHPIIRFYNDFLCLFLCYT